MNIQLLIGAILTDILILDMMGITVVHVKRLKQEQVLDSSGLLEESRTCPFDSAHML